MPASRFSYIINFRSLFKLFPEVGPVASILLQIMILHLIFLLYDQLSTFNLFLFTTHPCIYGQIAFFSHYFHRLLRLYRKNDNMSLVDSFSWRTFEFLSRKKYA
jgi:hypothetical protein